jgi:hypothetical protein
MASSRQTPTSHHNRRRRRQLLWNAEQVADFWFELRMFE